MIQEKREERRPVISFQNAAPFDIRNVEALQMLLIISIVCLAQAQLIGLAYFPSRAGYHQTNGTCPNAAVPNGLRYSWLK